MLSCKHLPSVKGTELIRPGLVVRLSFVTRTLPDTGRKTSATAFTLSTEQATSVIELWALIKGYV